jgi:hypothetical protein
MLVFVQRSDALLLNSIHILFLVLLDKE